MFLEILIHRIRYKPVNVPVEFELDLSCTSYITIPNTSLKARSSTVELLLYANGFTRVPFERVIYIELQMSKDAAAWMSSLTGANDGTALQHKAALDLQRHSISQFQLQSSARTRWIATCPLFIVPYLAVPHSTVPESAWARELYGELDGSFSLSSTHSQV